mmetsp:Transcript_14407/g.16521  ORF Transcript_14407/g.16521 Transcript_14407/m.16521 type:complete len:244 (+) Transcript_14407:78-809(+)
MEATTKAIICKHPFKLYQCYLLLTGILFMLRPIVGFNTIIEPSPLSSLRMPTVLSMGLFDALIPNFLKERKGDFVKLDKAETAFGPGPALLLYKVPPGVVNDEIQDMLADSAPVAFRLGVTLSRIETEENELMQCKVGDALDQMINNNCVNANEEGSDMEKLSDSGPEESMGRGCPVLYFSGFDNSEMMNAYNLLGSEIYQESGETPACAKVVPNAMVKQLGQILEEISGDHALAMTEKKKGE